jgi:hypothetical protein
MWYNYQENFAMMENSILTKCDFYGKELPSGHRCPSCPVAEDCQEAYEIREDHRLFADLTIKKIFKKVDIVIRRIGPAYHKRTLLGFRENGARISLFGASDTSLVLRLEYDGGRVLDSGKIFTFYQGWKATKNYKQITEAWLGKVREL